MSTISKVAPSLERQAISASLIVLGTIDDGPMSAPDYSTDPPQVHSTFSVSVQDTWRGRAPSGSVQVHVLGGRVDALETEWTWRGSVGDRVLMFLAPYYAVDAEEDTFVPYARGCYPVSSEGIVSFGGSEDVSAMHLDDLRSFVEAALARRDEANVVTPEREAEQPEISTTGLNALLHVEPGGARWASVDGDEAARRSTG